MGKLKKSTVHKTQKKKPKKVKLTIEELLNLAEECIDSFELESAYYYVKQALDLDPKHVEALEIMASVQMEMGNSENAKSIYEKLAELSPNEGFSKYMCLAQLSVGNEAVEYYKKGIELMLFEFGKQEQELGPSSPKKDKPMTSKAANDSDEEDEEDEEQYRRISKSDISTAYGSVAEIYLTDLCMEEEAADNCKMYLDKSLEYDSKNPESLQLMASYWLSKDDIDEAKKAILESLDCWMPIYREAEESGPLVDPSQAITLTYDARINTSRILTEVQEFDQALVVLEQLVEEDDEVVVTWYMLGWVNYCKGEDYYSNAKFYLKRADQLATKIKYDQKYLDDELKGHIKELLEKLAEVPSDDEDELTDMTNENEDEYETDEEEEGDQEEETAKDANNNNNNHQNGNHGAKIADLKAACSKSMNKSKNHAEEPMELT